MPISPVEGYPLAHWEHVKAIISETMSVTDFQVDMVSEAEGNGLIHNRIVTNVYENDIVICDVSAKNPNVMFELGMRLAFDKPVIIIKDDRTSYSFDANPIEHLDYPADLNYPAIQAFKEKLRERTIAAHARSLQPNYESFLKNFGRVVVKGLGQKEIGRDEYFMGEVTSIRNEIGALASLIRNESSQRLRVGWVDGEMIQNSKMPNMSTVSKYLDEFIDSKFESDPSFSKATLTEIAHNAARSYIEENPHMFRGSEKRRSEIAALFHAIANRRFDISSDRPTASS